MGISIFSIVLILVRYLGAISCKRGLICKHFFSLSIMFSLFYDVDNDFINAS